MPLMNPLAAAISGRFGAETRFQLSPVASTLVEQATEGHSDNNVDISMVCLDPTQDDLPPVGFSDVLNGSLEACDLVK